VETVYRYGRTVGEVFFPDGANLNKQIVGAGYAWKYKRSSKESAYADLEAHARDAKLRLWQEKESALPWDWSKSKR
jgi:endonuclease YncB( thermonuclease family)